MPTRTRFRLVNVHPLANAIAPLLEHVGGTAVPADKREPGDIVLYWDGAPAVAVRLPGEELTSALDRIIRAVEGELGGRLPDLPRADKQRAVRLLEERGAFSMRKSVETVAKALGVSRFTVYNYLNREQADRT
ncbi:helix-turn-helix domain-containing protein [Saccharopolyspora sp. ASAGF58]|uniref:helix-turn-helix domain-containing protein n=1 Tax=Saccharopolyspora sp. ASAGF58 TaxID=2719023 RepID=UPI001FF08F52|nr:helix-turn-helix domain-containing protein [Saccharopolyspora sp. ASAGF58]